MRISSGFVAALLASIAAGAAPGAQPAAAAAAPIDGKTLTKEKLQALPDDAVVQVAGKTYTARELRALAARSAPSRSSADAAKQKAKSEAAGKVAAFRAQEASRISGANSRLAGLYAGLHRTAEAGVVKALDGIRPEIVSVAGNAEPGAALYLQGRGFGSEPGTVLLKGLPIGDVKLVFDPAYQHPWHSTAVAVVVPDVSKVLDQSASIVVVRKDGMPSAPKNVAFTAARVVTMPPFPYRLLKCAKDVTHDQCGVFDLFWGDHVEHTLVENGGAGCDQFEVTAKPPWEFDQFHMWKENKGGSVGDAPAGRHGDVLRWNVCWSVRGDGPYSGNQASYTGYMLVKGPKGFPLD